MKTIKEITVGAGPINIVTALTAALVESDRVWGRKLSIQMKTGGTSRGYVIMAPVGIVPTLSAAQTVCELPPASATAPGGQYAEESSNESSRGELEFSQYWVHGANPSDVIKIAYE